ncbi:DUF2778 domain-containing protein [Klebsiella pneumoniae]|uniref:DUF2778 domain-containing protein n=1 Tax=Klebsiella pneumoniae TaxID=573 RepID=UPI001C8BCE27|nr:DUF2778 domain-containing protein [Klebsiella pneumoniae]MBX9262812.1 DUF2778 domain-containing protein [Klebsiella pneumoniae]HCS1354519.1 DUF2778 domain-containing protein [Klebsiella pneumoniae]HCU1092419.1 DUF2778 domain-containing protein [Klebsiella pneumoniae]
MALQGKLILNGADYAPFNLYGVGVFMAHSGRGVYRNKAACSAVVKDGPLPLGKYWIVDRNEGNWFSQKGREIKDTVNKIIGYREFGKSDWFALWRDDHGIDDETWVEGVKRGNFRLHPGTVSEGCITIAHNSDFAMIRNALMNTSLVQVPCMRSLMARGGVEVVASGSNISCP